MAQAVTVLAPAPDGRRLLLTEGVLRRALLAEPFCRGPVVVLVVAGPRGAGCSTLASHLLRAVSASERLPSTGLVETFPCREVPSGPPVGLDMWPELVPTTLPSGERAGLLLMSAWGVFDGDDTGAAVLCVSALLSSLLVVCVNCVGNGSDLGSLELLTGVGAAAASVDQCTPLQEVLFLVRQWNGTAPAGVQNGFEALEDWSQQNAANRGALFAMTEVSDLYQEVSMFLEIRGGSPCCARAEEDIVALLASKNHAKCFSNELLSADELFCHFGDIVEVLSDNLCRVDSVNSLLIGVLVKNSIEKAMQKAESAYDKCMKPAIDPSRAGKLQAAHERAAHSVRIVFRNCIKMTDHSREDDDLDGMLLARLDNKYKATLELLQSQAKELQRVADCHNEKLEEMCIERYKESMRDALAQEPIASLGDFMKHQSNTKEDILALFHNSMNKFGCTGDSARRTLYDQLESMFSQYLDTFTKRQGENATKEANIAIVVNRAEEHYTEIMKAVQPEQRHTIHERVVEGALAVGQSSCQLTSSKAKSTARSKLLLLADAALAKIVGQEQTCRSSGINRTGGAAGYSHQPSSQGRRPVSYQSQQSSHPGNYGYPAQGAASTQPFAIQDPHGNTAAHAYYSRDTQSVPRQAERHRSTWPWN